MDLEGIRQEMNRKPDAQYLLEWIERDAGSLDEACVAIRAYWAALGDED
jgi:hypothetical protein